MKYTEIIDLTLLNPIATIQDYNDLCEKAFDYNFLNVCVPSSMILNVKNKYNSFGICTVIGFPHGNCSTYSKVQESIHAIHYGADEIDVVANIGLLKGGDLFHYKKEIETIVKEVRKIKKDTIIKVIIETDYLTFDEVKTATQACINAKVDFIKTSTGFALTKDSLDVKLEKVKLIKSLLEGTGIKIKVSGGIKTYQDIERFLEIGVDRFGMSSLLSD